MAELIRTINAREVIKPEPKTIAESSNVIWRLGKGIKIIYGERLENGRYSRTFALEPAPETTQITRGLVIEIQGTVDSICETPEIRVNSAKIILGVQEHLGSLEIEPFAITPNLPSILEKNPSFQYLHLLTSKAEPIDLLFDSLYTLMGIVIRQDLPNTSLDRTSLALEELTLIYEISNTVKTLMDESAIIKEKADIKNVLR